MQTSGSSGQFWSDSRIAAPWAGPPRAPGLEALGLLGLQKQMSQLGTMHLCVLCLYVLRVLILWRTQYRFKHKTDQSHSWTPGCL